GADRGAARARRDGRNALRAPAPLAAALHEEARGRARAAHRRAASRVDGRPEADGAHARRAEPPRPRVRRAGQLLVLAPRWAVRSVDRTVAGRARAPAGGAALEGDVGDGRAARRSDPRAHGLEARERLERREARRRRAGRGREGARRLQRLPAEAPRATRAL